MAKHRVLLTDYAWTGLEIEREVLGGADAELIVAQDPHPEALARAAADVDAIMTNWARVSDQVIAAGRRLRIVARLGIGLDNIDVAAATERGILVTNVPDYCLIEVAEHALALLLGLGRKIGFYHHETKLGRYNLKAGPAIARIEGQTLGIIGLGNIGLRLAEKALALRLKLLVTGRSPRELPPGMAWTDLNTLLAESDYVSLHVPLTAQTRGLIGQKQLARMKPTACLINTARGGLIDHAALAMALKDAKLAGAGLDVQDQEPPDLSQPPYNDPRVIVTPHAAFVSRESLINRRTRTAQQVVDCLQGKQPENVVNGLSAG